MAKAGPYDPLEIVECSFEIKSARAQLFFFLLFFLNFFSVFSFWFFRRKRRKRREKKEEEGKKALEMRVDFTVLVFGNSKLEVSEKLPQGSTCHNNNNNNNIFLRSLGRDISIVPSLTCVEKFAFFILVISLFSLSLSRKKREREREREVNTRFWFL